MSLRILLHDPAGDHWLGFDGPREILEARTPEEVLPVLGEVERRVDEGGLFAAGYVAYEAAAGFDPALETREQSRWPLVAFGLYDEPAVRRDVGRAEASSEWPEEWVIDVDESDYRRNIRRIRKQIALGNTYQVNYTIRARAARIPDPFDLFRRMGADAPYAAYVESEHYAIASASPELFFRQDGEQLVSRPMKGTARRGLTLEDDRAIRDRLEASAKDRAENIMIADMIRNDIGRIARTGSVAARDLFSVERYPTVWQMTSTVAAESDAGVAEIFRALFPCASVTGAPKVSSMALIARLETSERHVYTGAIGYLAPRRQAQFSVAIRTAFVDRERREAVYGIGGGIVWNSKAGDEYEECLSKARILRRRPSRKQFELLETLRWTPEEGYFLLEKHLDRLRRSAEYFDFPFDETRVRQALDEQVSRRVEGRQRVRLLLADDGEVRTSAAAAPAASNETSVVRLAPWPIDAADPFLYHKTSWRDVYQRALGEVADCDDVLLWNADGYVTESTVANVLFRDDGRLCTPPAIHGLLAGTYRQWLLDQGLIVERPLHLSNLVDGVEVVLINSVRGEYPAVVRVDESVAMLLGRSNHRTRLSSKTPSS